MNTFEEEFGNLPDQQLPAATQDLHLAYLHSLAEQEGAPGTGVGTGAGRRRRKRRWLFVAGAVAVLVGGGAAGAAAAGFFRVTDTSTGFCYSADSLGAVRVEYATADGNAAENGLDVCAVYWRSGAFREGVPADPDAVPTGQGHPVPPLTACALETGQVGVFPGDAAVCGRLGLGEYPDH